MTSRGRDPADAWAVRVPATSANLGPGFDALGVALDRHLFVATRPRGGTRVHTTGEGAGDVPTDDTNLVWSSLVRFCGEHDVPAPDVSLRVHNEIPLERGLGSSSAAIVAGLGLGRVVTDTVVGDLDLVRLATAIEGHPDNVAPAVLGGFVACAVDTDGELVIRRAQPSPRTRLVVAVPPTRQNTSEARGVLPTTLGRGDVATQAARAVHVAAGLVGTWPVDARAVGDLLHEPPRLAVMAPTRALLEAWRDVGLQAWLSGAGPTAAAVIPALAGETAGRATELARAHGFDASVVDWDLAGVLACPPHGCAISALPGCVTCPRNGL